MLMAVPKFERFFRLAAGLDVDKDDLKRFSDFVFDEIYDLLIIGRVAAKSNRRDVIELYDLPITKGLQERMREFEKLDEQLELAPILASLAARPQMDVSIGDETEARLPAVAGGVGVALARSFRILEPRLKNPQTAHWERVFQLFDLLL
jgi:hypothetical protein